MATHQGRGARSAAVLGGLALALGAAILGATALGAVAVPLDVTAQVILKNLGLLPPDSVAPRWDAIIFLIRLPRVLGAVLIGAALATAGASLQALLRNPMADPGLLGVSAGAGLGAVVSIGLGLPALTLWATPGLAVLGALVGSAAILGLAGRRRSVLTLILGGMAVSTFFGAGTSLVLTFVSHDSVAQYLFWAMGSLANLRWESLGLVALPTLICGGLLLGLGRVLNLLLLGEDEARSVGVEVGRVRLLVLVLVAMATAAAVSVAGPIGFVGLMVPHILRLVLGPDNRLLLPASALGGGLFLVLCDALARVVAGPVEINVGIVTALVGAPYFLFLLVRQGRQGGSL